MKSKDFLQEIADPFASASQPNSVSSQKVRMTFLQDFLNDAFVAIDTAIKTGIVTLQPTSATQTQTQANTEPEKKAEPKITTDPNFVLEQALDVTKNLYLAEQEQGMSLAEYVEDFFSDYVKGAKADYSRYRPQIQKLAKQVEQEYIKNPRGKFGIGYSKPLRTALTQLGDIALLIYKQKRSTGVQQQQQTTAKAQERMAVSKGFNELDTIADLYGIDIDTSDTAQAGTATGSQEQPIVLGKDKYYKTAKGWVDSKGNAAAAGWVPTLEKIAAGEMTAAQAAQSQQPQQTKKMSTKDLEQWISGLNTRQKQQLITYINKTMPAGQDLT